MLKFKKDSFGVTQPRLSSPLFVFTTRLVLLILVVFICLSNGRNSPKGRDFYKILGVPRDADVSLIKKRYRQLSKELHPDANANASAQAFIDVRDAHEALANPETRKRYDMYGEQGLDPNFSPHSTDTFHSSPFFFRSNEENFFFPFRGKSEPFSNFFFQQQDFFQKPEPSRDLFLNSKSNVVRLSSVNWKTHIDGRNWIALVFFYSMQCTGCAEFEKVYERLATAFHDIFPLCAVNCDMATQLCHQQHVQTRYSLLLYLPKKENIRIEYQDNKLLEAPIKQWLNLNIPSYGEILSPSLFESWLISKNHLPKIIFITPGKLIPLWFRSVLYEFQSSISLALLPLKVSSCHSTAMSFLEPFIWKNLNHPILFFVKDIDKIQGEIIPIKHQSRPTTSLIFSRILATKRLATSQNQPYRFTRQLTRRQWRSGECGSFDSKICFILFIPTVHYKDSLPVSVLQKELELNGGHIAKGFWIPIFQQSSAYNAFGFKMLPSECFSLASYATCPVLKTFPLGFPTMCGRSVITPPRQCYNLVALKPKRNKYQTMEAVEGSTSEMIASFLNSVLNVGVPFNKHPRKPLQVV